MGFTHADERPQLFVFLVEHLGVPEMISQLKSALVSCIADIADFGGFVLLPFLKMELFIE